MEPAPRLVRTNSADVDRLELVVPGEELRPEGDARGGRVDDQEPGVEDLLEGDPFPVQERPEVVD
eukprot:7980930-Alexandrium_andersonii.AAC.1